MLQHEADQQDPDRKPQRRFSHDAPSGGSDHGSLDGVHFAAAPAISAIAGSMSADASLPRLPDINGFLFPFAGLIKTRPGNHVGYSLGTSMALRKKIVKKLPAVIKVTVSEAEKAALTKAAKQASLPLATYVRVVALEKAKS